VGSIVTSFTSVTGPGLKPFDTVVELATPFIFDATSGKNLLLDVTVPSCPVNALISFDVANIPNDSVSIVRVKDAASGTVAAVLPGSRSVQVGTPARAFATMLAVGPGTATDCSVAPPTPPQARRFDLPNGRRDRRMHQPNDTCH
jgi:hypothetical protein